VTEEDYQMLDRSRSFSILNSVLHKIADLQGNPCALPIILFFSSLLMGSLFIVTMNVDLNYDGEIYVAAAIKFALGEYRDAIAIYPMPLYPLLILCVHKIIPNWVLAGRIISVLSIIFTTIPLFLLTRNLFNARAAFWAGIVYTLMPVVLQHSNTVLRDPAFAFCFVYATYFAQQSIDKKQVRFLALCAFFAFVSTLFRVEGLILIPICLCIFASNGLLKVHDRKYYFKIVVIWTLVWVIIAITFLILVRAIGYGELNRFHEWYFYYSGYNDLSLFENYQRINEHLIKMRDSTPNLGVGQNFADIVKSVIPLIYVIGIIKTLLSMLLIFHLVFFIFGAAKADYRLTHVFVLVLVAVLIALACGFSIRMDIILDRYLFVPVILLSAWIGFGIEQVLLTVRQMKFQNLISACIVSIIIFIPAIKFNHLFAHGNEFAARAVAWIAKQETIKGLNIVFNDQVVRFYATNFDTENTSHYLLYNVKKLSAVEQFAREKDAKAIVIQHNLKEGGLRPITGYKIEYEIAERNKLLRVYVKE
jgi:hypothetical protein